MDDARLWPEGTATGIGSLPGVDIETATVATLADWPDLPFLPELPDRGPGADMVGRTAGVLVDLFVDVQPSAWRLVPRPGLDWRRISDFRARDLDALEVSAEGYDGLLKVQLAGPWTMAASVELTTGHKALSDDGAVRDLTESLAEGAAAFVAEVAARVPAAQVVLQVDEPSLPAVLRGAIPTASGYGRINPVEESVAETVLRQVVTAVGVPVIGHCCAQGVPVALLAGSGVRAVALDVSLVTEAMYDEVAESVDRGLLLVVGAVPTDRDPQPGTVHAAARRVRALASALGVPPDQVARRMAISPACGLAGASPDRADSIGRAARAIAAQLRDNPDDEDRRD